jgi:hypothetical protein
MGGSEGMAEGREGREGRERRNGEEREVSRGGGRERDVGREEGGEREVRRSGEEGDPVATPIDVVPIQLSTPLLRVSRSKRANAQCGINLCHPI